jgi:signal transduction histidine kinase
VRARLVAALVVTSAITLIVAALALLNPLETRLGHQEVRSLLATATASRASFEDLPARAVKPGSRVLLRLARGLERRSGARVVVLDAFGGSYADTRPGLPLKQVPRPEPGNRPAGTLVAVAAGPSEARVTVPLEIEGASYLLTLRKPLDNVNAAASDVRRAFATAALAGLATALLVGLGVATYITRRLRRLRDAAVDVAARGPEAPLPAVGGRDEVGDLALALRRMQERLRELEEARTQFLATASHELRTPVASLQGMLELARMDLAAIPPDVADAREQVERAEVQSRRLGALTGDLLDVTRLDAGLELREEPVAVGEVCRAVAAEFDLRAQAVGRSLQLDLGEPTEDAVRASGDPTAVARVLRILIDNALRYSPDGAAVRVSVRSAGSSVEVGVWQPGPGVPDGEGELIFQRFKRGSEAPSSGGFGLGLAIGRGLARYMGGDLVLDPSMPGVRFVLRLREAEPAPVGPL